MVVRLDAGTEAIRAYVHEHAALGLAHVTNLIRADRDSMASLTEGLSEAQANFAPAEGEFSVSQVLQHLNTSFDRSQARLHALSSGQAFTWNGPPARPGGLPEKPGASFAEVRREFLAG